MKEPLILEGEELIEQFNNSDGHPALILKDADGNFRLREWDDVHGWGDRTYRDLTRLRKAIVGEY